MRRLPWPAIALGLAACGRLDFAIVADAPAARDAALADGSLDARAEPMEPMEPWGAPQPLTALNTASEDADPELRGDGLELLFHSARPGGPGGLDLYRAVRATTADPFDAPVLVAELATAGDEIGPALSGDGLVLYFSDGADIVFATRPSLDAEFGPRQPVAALSSPDVDTAPEVSGDGLVAIVVRGVGDARDLWIHTRTADGPPDVGWSAGEPLLEVASSVTDGSPDLDRQGHVLAFHSDRAAGIDDIFVATRASTSDPFGAPALLGPGVISTSSDEGDPTLSADRRTIVFHRAVDLYLATR